MKEWKDKYNSFNSWKGLLYKDHYEAVAREEFLPPIEASLDPIHACNLRCRHCNAHRYLTSKSKKIRRIPDDHLMNLIHFLADWGVKAICFGGGGEPTMHTKLAEAITLASKLGLDTSVATNGTLFSDELITVMAKYCRWVGISVDAAKQETYVIQRNADMFDTVIKNIKRLVKKRNKLQTNCDIAYKFLITPLNQREVLDACIIASELGVDDFHARPADLRHQGLGRWTNQTNAYYFEELYRQFTICHVYNNNKFRVFTVLHKFDDQFKPKKNFEQCYAAPLCIQICADDYVYLCPDQRHRKFYRLGKHFPNIYNIKKFWGNEKHKKLVYSIGASNCKSRCTFAPYNEQCERLFIEQTDPMCKWFI